MTAARPSAAIWDAAAIGAYVALALLQYGALLPHLSDAIPADVGDPLLNTWILWWNTQQPPWAAAYWHAPAFAPAPYALALSETLLGVTIVTTPLQWLGASPLQAYNTLFVLTPILNGAAGYALCRVLAGRRDAAFVGGLYFMMAPYRASQLPHVQTLATFYMPVALLSLHAYWRDNRPRWLVVLAAATVLNGLVSGYHLVYFAAPLGLCLLWMALGGTPLRRVATVAAVLGASLLVLLPVLLAYQRVRELWDLRRSLGEMSTFSADVTSFLAGNASLAWHWWPTFYPKPEADVYPGLVVIAVLLIGAIRWWQRDEPSTAVAPRWVTSARRFCLLAAGLAGLAALGAAWAGPLAFELGALRVSIASLHKPIGAALDALVLYAVLSPRLWAAARRQSIAVLYGVMFVIASVLMLGPEPQVMGWDFWYKAPLTWLLELPGFDTVRVPARWATIQVLAGAVLIALALSAARARLDPRRAQAVVLACAAIIIVEGWIRPPIVSVPSPLPLGLTADLVVELPTRGWTEDVAAMYRGMAHGRPVVNGYSGYSPPHYPHLAADLQAGCLESLNAIRRGRSLDVVVHAGDQDGARVLNAVRGTWPGARQTQIDALVVVHVAADPDRADAAYDDPIDLRDSCRVTRSESANPH